MQLILPEELNAVADFLNADPYLYLYAIGDLDKRFKPYIDWYKSETSGVISAVICVYKGGDSPTVMALSEDPEGAMSGLLGSVISALPEHFQTHLSPGLEKCFESSHLIESTEAYYKMALTDEKLLMDTDTTGVERLGTGDIPQLLELYKDSYPGNWFEPDMLGLNRYCGIKKNGQLIAAAGTHVYSPVYRAAALGNITTRPEYRGHGFGAGVTAGLSRLLLKENIRIGLNVKQDNPAAISCYRKIGFSIHAEYGEYIFRKKQ